MTTVAPDIPEAPQLENGRIVAITGPVIDVEFPPQPLRYGSSSTATRFSSPRRSPSRSARAGRAASA